jgi:hypothetical protein
LHIGYEGLQLVEEYVRQLPDNGNIQILLAVYIEILRQELMEVSPQHPSSIELMIESEKVKLFLEDYKGRFFDEDSSILQDLAFRLIDAAEVVRRKSPFNIGYYCDTLNSWKNIFVSDFIDVNSQILHFLLDERTNINVRKTIENLAIQRISNSEEPSLLDGIVEILLGTDYRIIVNNIARIIEPFVQRLSIQQAEELMEKAKNTEKIGVLFARLSAAI